ncbi:hypothetical protein BFJ69_g17358 [Fusarium oxysporum]|uniref:Uncharacterized protein n=1 Tax=Fusarium oxysporum TaxID=5507 RepID=A0A420M8I2_FUSOX|nr:hypothetical protein BFJ69_g17358 [Fusarium oxysporum]
MGEALDAPATEAEVVVAGAAVAVGDNLEQEGRALVHDGDNRDRDAVSQAWRTRLSAELMTKVRQIKDGNAEKSLKEEEKGYGRQYQSWMNIGSWPFQNQAVNLWNLERGCVMANHQAALSGCTAF